ncbi:MAG: hypothetical protein ACETVN_02025 [Asgard group archaeon]
MQEETRKNTLYVNLGTIFGAALIGHMLADGTLSQIRIGSTQFRYTNIDYKNVVRVNRLLEYFGQRVKILALKGTKLSKKAFHISAYILIPQAIRRIIPKAVGNKTITNPPVPKRITGNKQTAIAFLQSIILDEATVDSKSKSKYINVVLAVDVTEGIKQEFIKLLKEIVNEKLEKIKPKMRLLEKMLKIFEEEKIEHSNKEEVRTILEKAMKSLGSEAIQTDKVALKEIFEWLSKETEITKDILKKYLNFIETQARRVVKNEVNSDLVQWAESKTNNILQSVIRAFKTLDISPKKGGIRSFYMSGDGRITAASRIFISGPEGDKAYKLGLIKGYKEQNFKANVDYQSVPLFYRKKGEGKLSESQIELLESEKNKDNRVTYSKIKNHKDIIDIIQNNKPKELEDKYKVLINNGTKASLKPLYVRMGKKVINVKWCLVSWLGGKDRNGLETEDS